MNSLRDVLDSQVVLFIAAIVVAVLALRLLFRVVSVGLGSLLGIIAIAVLLEFFLGISPRQLWYEVSHLPQEISQFVKSLG